MICYWKTGHEIADTVAEAFNGELRNTATERPTPGDINIGYGILRGMDWVFKRSERYFHLDRGYFSPGHFDGYYRISYKGTQAQFSELRAPWDGELAPFRFSGRSVMICPPTKPVCDFFGIDLMGWIDRATNEAQSNGYSCFVRTKGDDAPINWDDVKAVITFNSSLGWQALQMGIPVLSDIDHSIVGSHYRIDNLQKLTSFLQEMPDSRRELFQCMRAHDFTLGEIRRGKAWPLIQHYLSTSALMIGKKSQPMSAPIQSGPELKRPFQSNT